MRHVANELVLTTSERKQLRRLVATLGERKLMSTIILSRSSLARVLAGLPVRRGTLELVRAGLRKLEAADAFGESADVKDEHGRDARVAEAQATNEGVDR
jgi:hypothetical protein